MQGLIYMINYITCGN